MTLRRHSAYLGRRAHLHEAVLERFVMSAAGDRYTMHLAPRIDRFLIPWTRGRFSSLGHRRVGSLTSTGAKSGLERTNPVLLIPMTDGLLAIGSNYGRPTHPSWSANLIAHPTCTIEYDGSRGRYHARLLEGAERAETWATVVDYSIAYRRYEARCAPRQIRVFLLTPEAEPVDLAD